MAGAPRLSARDIQRERLGTIRVDARELIEFARQLDDTADDQLPFALAAALSDTARTARDEVRERLPKFFTIRNRGVRSAIEYKSANKRDPEPAALVHTQEWAGFLTLHAIGGTKRARGSRVAVPTSIVKRTASGRVPKRFQPRPLRGRRGLQESALPGGRLIVRGVRSVPRGLSIFYHLVRGAKIRKSWPLEDEVARVVARDMRSNFERRFDQALATRRARASTQA